MMINFSNVNTQKSINLPPDNITFITFINLYRANSTMQFSNARKYKASTLFSHSDKCKLTIIMKALGKSENPLLRN
jgi:hypothetical protein